MITLMNKNNKCQNYYHYLPAYMLQRFIIDESFSNVKAHNNIQNTFGDAKQFFDCCNDFENRAIELIITPKITESAFYNAQAGRVN